MPDHPASGSAALVGRTTEEGARFKRVAGVVAVFLLSAGGMHAQAGQESMPSPMGTATETASVVRTEAQPKQPVESEISVMGMVPAGDYRMFSATVRCNAWSLGVEYDRHSWGHLLKSQVDYVAEILPVMMLSQPAVSDYWGNPVSPNQEIVPGVSISPFGFRFLWRSGRRTRPFVIGKLGAAVFTKKAMSQNASYANFNVQSAFGMEIRMSDRLDLRVEPFNFFHVSNGYLAASNPGMDEITSRIGFTYHLQRRRDE